MLLLFTYNNFQFFINILSNLI